jgi:hypothetical protein
MYVYRININRCTVVADLCSYPEIYLKRRKNLAECRDRAAGLEPRTCRIKYTIGAHSELLEKSYHLRMLRAHILNF